MDLVGAVSRSALVVRWRRA
jgi:endogenous inhibitor of DNA gyrase (YacG/DUF329 family)